MNTLQDVRYIFQNFKVPTINKATISAATTSVCPRYLSFLIRTLFKAKQHCPEIEKKNATSEQVQVKDIILNMSFWKNWKLTAYSKDFVKKGHLWIFALVSQLNCSRSITGTSASTLLPVDSSSPTPRLAHPKHWAAILFIAPPKLKTSCQWLFMGDGTSTSSQHCTPGAPSATFISTF